MDMRSVSLDTLVETCLSSRQTNKRDVQWEGDTDGPYGENGSFQDDLVNEE